MDILDNLSRFRIMFGYEAGKKPLQIKRIDLGHMLRLLRAGKANVNVARRLGCTREYVRQCRNKFEREGLLSPEIVPHRVSKAKAVVTTK